MSLTQNITHVQQAKARLIAQYKGKANIEAFIEAYANQVQEIENVLFDLLLLRGVDTATGALLDLLGAIVGRPRDGLGDTDYRLYIKAQIRANISNGNAEELIAIMTLLVSGASFDLVEQYPTDPATLIVRIDDQLVHDGNVIARILHKAKSAGVRVVLEWFEDASPFVFANGVGGGFGDGTWANAKEGDE
jgi:hypothetical protein